MVPHIHHVASEILLHCTSLSNELKGLSLAKKSVEKHDMPGVGVARNDVYFELHRSCQVDATSNDWVLIAVETGEGRLG